MKLSLVSLFKVMFFLYASIGGASLSARATPSKFLPVDATSMLLSGDGRSLAWGNTTKTVWVDAQTRRLVSKFWRATAERPQALALSKDGRLALMKRGKAGGPVAVELWKRRGNGAALKWSWTTNDDASAAAFLNDRILIYRDTSVWTLDWWGHKTKRQNVGGGLGDLDAFSSDGRYLWRSCLNDLRTGRTSIDCSFVNGTRFSPSGRFILVSWVSMLNDQESWVFDTRTGKSVTSDVGYDSLTSHVSYDSVWAPDDTLSDSLYTQPVRFYNVRSGKESRFRIPQPWGLPQKRHLRDLQFSRDGHMMAALQSNGRIWLAAPLSSSKQRAGRGAKGTSGGGAR